jgi:hypothetical protein
VLRHTTKRDSKLLLETAKSRILQHNAHFRDYGCGFWHPLTPFLTPLARRRPRDREPLFLGSCCYPLFHHILRGPKYRKPKMASHDLRARSFEGSCLCSTLHGPLQLQIWTAFLLPARLFPTTARQSTTQLSYTTFSELSEPIQGSSSTCTLLFPFSACFPTLHYRPPSLAFVLTFHRQAAVAIASQTPPSPLLYGCSQLVRLGRRYAYPGRQTCHYPDG